MMQPERIRRGTIRLPWPKGGHVDFVVLPPSYPEEACFNAAQPYVAGTLSDGLRVIGQLWGVRDSQQGPTPKGWHVDIEIPEGFILDKASRRLTTRVARTFVRRTCVRCKRLTRFELDFTTRVEVGVFSKSRDATESRVAVCERCFYFVLIERILTGDTYWNMIIWNSTYRIGARYSANLGTVLLDVFNSTLVQPAVMPDFPTQIHQTVTITSGDTRTPILTFQFKGGILRVHDPRVSEELSRRFGTEMDDGIPLDRIGAFLNIPAAFSGRSSMLVREIVDDFPGDAET